MKTLFSTIICMLMLSGCASTKLHLKHKPDRGEKLLDPIELETEIKVDSISIRGFKTDVSLWEQLFESPSYFPTLKEDIEKVIIKDLRNDLFPLEGDSAEIFVNVKVGFGFKKEFLQLEYILLASTGAAIVGGLIGYAFQPFEMTGDYPGSCLDFSDVRREMNTILISGCFVVGANIVIAAFWEKNVGISWISCEILDKKGAFISQYEKKIKIKKNNASFNFSFNLFDVRTKEQKMLEATLKEVLSDIKSQIDRDREKILEAVKD